MRPALELMTPPNVSDKLSWKMRKHTGKRTTTLSTILNELNGKHETGVPLIMLFQKQAQPCRSTAAGTDEEKVSPKTCLKS